MNFKVGNVDVNLSIKIKNIFGGKGFGSRMDMFKKKTDTNESTKIMTTGVSMKDRLNLFNNRGITQPQQAPQNKPPPKKIRPSMDFANKLMNNVGAPNKAPNANKQNEIKKEESSKEIKENDNKNNDKPIEKKNDEIKEEVKIEEDKVNKIDENQSDNKEKVEEPKNQEQNNQEKLQNENQSNEEQKKEIQKPENIEEEVKDNNQKEEDKKDDDNDKEKATEEPTVQQLEIPKEENINQKDEDKNISQNEENNLMKKEIGEVKIENKNENKALNSKIKAFEQKDNLINKRQSMQVPSISQIKLSNKVNLESKEQPKKQNSKKIENYKMLLAQKFLGLPLKVPQKENTQKKEEDNNNITPKPEENKGETNPTPTPTPEAQVENPQNSISATPTPIQNPEEENPIDSLKKGASNLNEEKKNPNTIIRKSMPINSINIDDFDFEVLESDSSQNSLIEGFLDPVKYDKYLSDLKQQGKKEDPREAFCEGFFIASYPRKDGKVIEKSDGIPALCGHDECKVFYAMKPEIVMRYPLKDTKSLELNNLAATICFPNGIKVCYSDNEPPKKM